MSITGVLADDFPTVLDHERARVKSLDSMRAGDCGTIARLDAPESAQSQRLVAMGLAPGVELRVEQRSLAFVVLVGENVIAMEAQVARGVFILS